MSHRPMVQTTRRRCCIEFRMAGADAGKFFDVVIAVWSLSVMATFIGLVAGMSVVQRAVSTAL